MKINNANIHAIVCMSIEEGLEEFAHTGNALDLNHLDVSEVTDMAHLFQSTNLEVAIDKWDVSNVKNMDSMFAGSNINPDLSKWNVSNVDNMNSIFSGSSFINDISKWNLNFKDLSTSFRKNMSILHSVNNSELQFILRETRYYLLDECYADEYGQQYSDARAEALNLYKSLDLYVYDFVNLGKLIYKIYKRDQGLSTPIISIPAFDFNIDFS